LWERLLVLCRRHDVSFNWVRGHAGNPGNEEADSLSVTAMEQKNLGADAVYETFVGYSGKETSSSSETSPSPGPKTKITYEGQPCRKCGTPVIKRIPKRRKPKEGQTYFYEFYFYCPSCKTMYMVDEAKRDFPESSFLF
jgi:ribonuclease HI